MISVKASFKGCIRKLRIDPQQTGFAHLKTRLAALFSLQDKDFSLCYRDEEDDLIVFDTDLEWNDLLEASPNVCRIFIALAGDDFEDILSTTTTRSAAALVEEGYENIQGPSSDPNVFPFIDINNNDGLSMHDMESVQSQQDLQKETSSFTKSSKGKQVAKASPSDINALMEKFTAIFNNPSAQQFSRELETACFAIFSQLQIITQASASLAQKAVQGTNIEQIKDDAQKIIIQATNKIQEEAIKSREVVEAAGKGIGKEMKNVALKVKKFGSPSPKQGGIWVYHPRHSYTRQKTPLCNPPKPTCNHSDCHQRDRPASTYKEKEQVFESQLNVLEAMGFENRELNLELLKSTNGDLTGVLQMLL